jgi:hypothetical protein
MGNGKPIATEFPHSNYQPAIPGIGGGSVCLAKRGIEFNEI